MFEILEPENSVAPVEPEAPLADETEATESPETEALETQAEDDQAFTDIDPASLSPELQAIYKRMESGLQKKFQALAEEKKSLGEKAGMLDRILTDPEYRSAVLKSLGGAEKAPEAQEGTYMRINPHEGFKLSEHFDEQTVKGMEAAAANVIEKYLLPKLKPYENALVALLSQQVNTGWQDLVKQYPGAEKHRVAVDSIRQQAPNLSLEQALFAVAGRELVQARGGSKTLPSKKVSLTRGSAVPASKASPIVGKGVDMLDIVRAVLKEHGGMPAQG